MQAVVSRGSYISGHNLSFFEFFFLNFPPKYPVKWVQNLDFMIGSDTIYIILLIDWIFCPVSLKLCYPYIKTCKRHSSFVQVVPRTPLHALLYSSPELGKTFYNTFGDLWWVGQPLHSALQDVTITVTCAIPIISCDYFDVCGMPVCSSACCCLLCNRILRSILSDQSMDLRVMATTVTVASYLWIGYGQSSASK